MLSGRTIIIPLGADWKFHCEYEKQTALILSKKNRVVVYETESPTTFYKLFTDSAKRSEMFRRIRSLSSGLIFFPNIGWLPFQRNKLITLLNKEINLVILNLFISFRKNRMLWIFYPKFQKLIDKIPHEICIYDCIDNPSSLDGKDNEQRRSDEISIMKKADFVFTNSKTLYNLKNKYNKNTYQVAQGFNIKPFLRDKSKKIPKSITKLPRPIIGFIGNIDHRIDYRLLYELSKKRPEWSFVMIGPQYEDEIQSQLTRMRSWLKKVSELKNVHILKRIEHREVWRFIDSFDIGMIPYDVSQTFCKYCFPTKTFEYLSRGKQIVTTPIRSLINLSPMIKLASDSLSFSAKIEESLDNRPTEKTLNEALSLAKMNTWQNKIEQISSIIQDRVINHG